MRRRRLATGAWALAVGWLPFALVTTALYDGAFSTILGVGSVVVTFASVGLVLCRKAPGNAIGPLFLSLAVLASLGILAEGYARLAFTHPDLDLPGALAAAVWANAAQSSPLVVVLVYTLLLFPDGTITPRGLRPLAYVAGVAAFAATAFSVFHPGPLFSIADVDNPIGIGGSVGRVLSFVGGAGYLVLLGVMLAAAGSLLRRFRRSTGTLRQQLKVLIVPVALLPTSFLLGDLVLFQVHARWAEVLWSVLFFVSATSLPLATGVAIVRYRLYGIDAVIRRTLVYATLVASLGVLYLLAIVAASGVSRAVTGQSGALAVTVSTLAVAALARPLQRRIQAGVDRRFFRSRYDAQATLTAFGDRLRDEVGLELVARELVVVADGAVRPAHASIWLRPVTFPERAGGTTERTWQPS
jgi:hypothetical protein